MSLNYFSGFFSMGFGCFPVFSHVFFDGLTHAFSELLCQGFGALFWWELQRDIGRRVWMFDVSVKIGCLMSSVGCGFCELLATFVYLGPFIKGGASRRRLRD